MTNEKGSAENPETAPLSSVQLVTLSSKESALKAMGGDLKIKIDTEIKVIREMKIIDNDTMLMYRNKLTDANKFSILIEKRRKNLKKPYKDSGEKIDLAAKYLTDELNAVILEGKQKLLLYEQQAKEKEEEANQRAELEASKKLKEEQVAVGKSTETLTKIASYKTEAIIALSECKTMELLKNVHEKYIKGFPQTEFSGFEMQAGLMKNELIIFKDGQKEVIKQIIIATEADDEEAVLQLEHNARLEAIRQKKATATEIQTQITKVTAESQTKQEEVLSEMIGTQTAQKVDIGRTREDWDWEIDNWDNVPDTWKMINGIEIATFIKTNKKETLIDGCIISGIKFFIKKGIVL